MWLWIGTAIARPVQCHTMHTWSTLQQKELRYYQATKSELEHIDTFQTPMERVEFSEHFALHWGTEWEESSILTDVLTLLEQTWDVQVGQWGMDAPVDGMYFNVYLGGTGQDMPDDLGVAGYYDVDNNGYPMVVLGPYVTNSWSIGKTTVPHEFFHAVQHRTGQFTQFQDRWYWEASATWVEQEILPGHPSHADFLFGYALRPYLPLAHFELFSSGNIEEYHSYGAFIFLQYLTDFHVENDSVVESWIDAAVPESVRPLNWWNVHLSDKGLSLGTLLSDMAAHNVHWDYPNHVIYETKVAASVGSDPSLDERLAGELTIDGETSRVPSSLRPGAYGYNQWTFDVFEGESELVELYFDGTTVGDHFNAVTWRLQLVKDTDVGIEYTSFNPTAGEGVWEVDSSILVGTTLVVLADSTDAHIDETFTYSVGLRSIVESEKRMGCATLLQHLPTRQGLLILLVPVLVRRRNSPRDWDSGRVR